MARRIFICRKRHHLLGGGGGGGGGGWGGRGAGVCGKCSITLVPDKRVGSVRDCKTLIALYQYTNTVGGHFLQYMYRTVHCDHLMMKTLHPPDHEVKVAVVQWKSQV